MPVTYIPAAIQVDSSLPLPAQLYADAKPVRTLESVLPSNIVIPTWDEVIHILPTKKITQEQWREYNKANEQKRAYNLPADVVQAIERQGYKINASKTSAQPSWYKTLGKVLTEVDNWNDALVTAAVALKVAAIQVPPAAPLLIPAAATATQVANIMNIALLANALAIPKLFKKRTFKTISKSINFKNVLRQTAKAVKLGRMIPSFAEAIQIAQTTDALFGVGVAIGPLYGLANEILFTTINKLTSQIVASAPVQDISAVIQKAQALDQRLKDTGQAGISWALKGISAVTGLLSEGQRFTPTEHLEQLITYFGCLSHLQAVNFHEIAEDILSPAIGLNQQLSQVSDPTLREILTTSDINADSWWDPIPWRPSDERSADEGLLAIGPIVAAAINEWVPTLPDATLIVFAHTLVQECAELAIRIIEGPEVEFRESYDPYTETMLQAFDTGFRPPSDTPAEIQLEYFESLGLTRILEEGPLTTGDIIEVYMEYDFPFPPPG